MLAVTTPQRYRSLLTYNHLTQCHLCHSIILTINSEQISYIVSLVLVTLNLHKGWDITVDTRVSVTITERNITVGTTSKMTFHQWASQWRRFLAFICLIFSCAFANTPKFTQVKGWSRDKDFWLKYFFQVTDKLVSSYPSRRCSMLNILFLHQVCDWKKNIY